MRENLTTYQLWVKLLVATGKQIVTTADVRKIMKAHNLKMPQWYTKDMAVRAGRGKYHVPFCVKSVDKNNA